MEEEGKIENWLEARKELIKLDWKFYFIYFPLFFFNSKFNKKRKDDGITILTGTCNGQLKKKRSRKKIIYQKLLFAHTLSM